MAIEIIIPSVGESITEALLAEWFVADGETVRKDDPLLVIETDKVTLEVVAETAGVLKITVAAGETVAIGAVVGQIDAAGAAAAAPAAKTHAQVPESAPAEATPPPAAAAPTPPPQAPALPEGAPSLAPSVRRLVAEKQIDITAVTGSGPGGRVTKGDLLLHLEQAPAGVPEPVCPPVEMVAAGAGAEAEGPQEVRQAMSPIRKRIASRLLASKQNTAMLTTDRKSVV